MSQLDEVWALTVHFAPVSNQGFEEQNPGDDYASRVLNFVREHWEYDDEASTDLVGIGYGFDTLWTLNESRTKLVLFSDVIDELVPVTECIMMRTIPQTLTLHKET